VKVSFCPDCRRLVLDGFSFCPYCGRALRQAAPSFEGTLEDSLGKAEELVRPDPLERLERLSGELEELMRDLDELIREEARRG
jgi:hypothetical protein